MTLLLNQFDKDRARLAHRLGARSARGVAFTVALAATAAACGESTPGTTTGNGGSAGQTTAGGMAVAGGTSNPTAGSPATSGAAGMPGSSGSATGGASAGTGGGGGNSSGSGGTGGAGGTAGGSAGSSGSGGGADGYVDLFNGKDLTGWTPGPTGKALFAVDSTAGEPAIHVYPTQADQSNQDQASLRTNDSFSSYVLHVEYKWGFKRFAGRAQNARDNGICWHVQLPLPNNSEWPTSIELQLGSDVWPGDWVSGNIFMLVNKSRATWPYTMMGNNAVYSPTSTTKKTIGANGSYEKALSIPPNQNKGGEVNATAAATEWNVVELTVHGSTDASYSVNGVVVNGVTDMKLDTGMPLDHGPIALQAEFAETYFRNIKIKVLP